ncbi:uncharacterized protein [Clytia hemisphaerica]|uniref:Uncharacterized protein n=1 Tax=Clytia hemisphaerica TaxID=252671 RepID=A0A7M5VEN7_9CNID
MVDLSDKPIRYSLKYKVFLQSSKTKPPIYQCIVLCFILVCLFAIFRSRDTLDSDVRSILTLAKTDCLKNRFQEYLLVIHFDEPYYKDITFIRSLYENIFGKVVICGPEPDAHSGRFVPDIEFESERGKFGYACLGKAIEKFPKYSGYFYSNYDLLINWWNLLKFDTSKIWMLKPDTDLQKSRTAHRSHQTSCQNYITFLQRFSNSPQFKQLWSKFQQSKSNDGTSVCLIRPSRFFYIPKRFTGHFPLLSYGAHLNQLEQHTAPINIVQSFVSIDQIEELPEYYRPPQYRFESSPLFWSEYDISLTIAHSFRLYRKNDLAWRKNLKQLVEKYFEISRRLTNC